MESRKYIKRPWRIPKDRGAPEFLAALIVKALVKHGWPAKYEMHDAFAGFQILHVDDLYDARPDFWCAVGVACRIVARTQRAEIDEANGFVTLLKVYSVHPAGYLRLEK